MKLLFIFLLAFPFYAISQKPMSLSEAIDDSGVVKNELFIRGREWFNENFKSSKDVLQISDKENGELVGKGIMVVDYVFRYLGERKYSTDVSFQMSLWVKDGKYKYEMTNFIVNANEGSIDFGLLTDANETQKTVPGYNSKKMNEMFLSIKKGTEVKAKLLIEDLKLKMSKKSKSADW